MTLFIMWISDRDKTQGEQMEEREREREETGSIKPGIRCEEGSAHQMLWDDTFCVKAVRS